MKAALTILAVSSIVLCWGHDQTVSPQQTKAIGRAELYWLLDRACSYGDDIGVRMLLSAGADPDGVKDYEAFLKSGWQPCEPNTPLFQAAWGGHTEIVALLIKAGAKLDLPVGEGYTPLTIACDRNHPKVVRQLLAAGADTAYRTPTGTALEIAKRKGLTDVVTAIETRRKDR